MQSVKLQANIIIKITYAGFYFLKPTESIAQIQYYEGVYKALLWS